MSGQVSDRRFFMVDGDGNPETCRGARVPRKYTLGSVPVLA